jgi:predicted RNA binding protein YcfA (HicA-like mRNA interferase family)
LQTPVASLICLCADNRRDIIRRLEDDGWQLIATRGSHRQFKHPARPGRVTVAGKPKDDIAPGTLNNILKQAGLKDK